MAKPKPRVIKNYEKLDEKLREAIAERFPNGYASEIQTFDIGGGKFMTALPFETDEFYIKSEEEMASLFPDWPEAVENTGRIAQRCNSWSA